MVKKIAMQFRKPSGFLGKIISNMMIKGNSPVYEILLKDMNIQAGDRLLEIGYGPGIGVNMVLTRFDISEFYGIDFSELMFARANKRNKQFVDCNKVKLLFGDFIETEINAKDFNKVFFCNVVYFWDNLQKPFEKTYSLLKNEGEVYFFMASREDLTKLKFTKEEIFNKYTIEQITDALKSAGFKDITHFYNKGYYIKAKK